MRSNNLVPKPITDKNGVTRTHWVSPEDQNASSKQLPAPPAPSKQEGAQRSSLLMEEALRLFYPNGHDSADTSYRNLWFLAQYSPPQMQALLDQCEGNKTLHQLWVSRLNNLTMHVRKRDVGEAFDGAVEGLLQTWQQRLRVYPLGVDLIARTGDDGSNPGLLRDYAKELEYRVHDVLWTRPASKRLTLPSDECIDAIALICIVRGAYDDRHARADNKEILYADIAPDVDYISENLERVKELVPELVQRGRYDSTLIKEMIENDSSALNSGLL